MYEMLLLKKGVQYHLQAHCTGSTRTNYGHDNSYITPLILTKYNHVMHYAVIATVSVSTVSRSFMYGPWVSIFGAIM